MGSTPSALPVRGRGSATAATAWRAAFPRGLRLAVAIILVGATIAAIYWPVLGAQALSFDDYSFVTENPLVTHPSWTSAGRFFREVLNPSTIKGYYLPLSMTSLMLDYAAGGRSNDLRVFHRTSLVLHIFNAVILVLILYRLFGALVPAALAGLLFGLHPLTVEPVAWVGERKTLLATFFALASLLSYVEFLCRERRGWRVASVTLYALALLSKPTVTMLPLILLLLDWWPLRRLRVRGIVEKWPFLLLSLLSGVITLISHQRTAGFSVQTPSDFLQWPLRAGYLLAFYLGKIVWPTELSCAYQPPVPFSISNPTVLWNAIAVCVFTGLLVLSMRRARGLLAGWLLFVIALTPTLGLVAYSWVIASDKYVYFPAVGILTALAWGLGAAWTSRRLRRPLAKALLVVPVLLALATEAQGVRLTLRNWKDSLTLFRHMERLAPDSAPVQGNLGWILEARSEHEEAIRHVRRALELEPNYGEAHHNLGIALDRQGRFAEAILHARRAVDLMPDRPDAALHLGGALRHAGRLDEALPQFERALRLKPDYLQAMDQLGSVLAIQGRSGEAVEQFRRAVALDSTDAVLHFKLGTALLRLGGHSAEAAKHLRQAIRCKPGWPVPINALAWQLATGPDAASRDPGEALQLAARAVELTGRQNPSMLDTQAAAEAAAGLFDQATRTAQAAVQLAMESRVDSLAVAIRARLLMYKQRIAYTEPVDPGFRPAGP